MEDLSLARALTLGDPAALRVFEQDVLSKLPRFLSRFHLSRSELDEVRQELRCMLFVTPRKIESYTGKGPLAAWVRVVAIRLVLTRLRRRKPIAPEQVDHFLAPDVLAIKDELAGPVNVAFKSAYEALSSSDRDLLRLYFVEGLNVGAIGEVTSVHKATAARRLVRLKDEFRAEVTRRLQGQLAQSTDLESVLRLLMSRVALSLA